MLKDLWFYGAIGTRTTMFLALAALTAGVGIAMSATSACNPMERAIVRTVVDEVLATCVAGYPDKNASEVAKLCNAAQKDLPAVERLVESRNRGTAIMRGSAPDAGCR